ncbi:U3 small nucleolar RNA-associated protein 14 [Pseudohyphozyma bogoriensis]|nr:U3 small nucleolar RNA-associated protein 14 [Pseudohyphozyma bogoriensis]
MARTARSGRAPKPLVSGKASSKSSSKPATSKPAKAKKASDPTASATPLDVYSLPASQKRARGDIDPQSRLNSKSASKGKGKRREDDSDSEGNEEEDEFLEFTGVKPDGLYMGGGDDDDDGGIRSEDDEDIDSDEAEIDVEDLPAKPKKGKGKAFEPKRNDINLEEDSEEDLDDEDGDGFMDIVELLDNNEYPSEEGSDEDGSDGSDDDDDDAEEDSDEDLMDEDDEDNFGALDKLGSFVDGLESKKRKAGGEVEQEGKKKKRVVLKEKTEAYPEGEFVAVTAPEGVQSDKLNLDDLLSSFSDSKNPRLANLRKTLKPLAAPSSTTTTSKTGPLAAPLPGRLQDKIEREAAYEKTKEETDKWNETVRRMKGESGLGVEGARHERLTLPLLGGAGDAARGASAAEWSAKFQPTNDLEASIQSLLTAGQMQTSDLRKAEKAALATLDPADVAARQAELRQQRDLMFRAERKAKRVAKIKSKAFRKIHRKKGKDGEPGLSLEDLEELDRIDGGDRVSEEKARMEIARARERASLKHSSKGGRWSKSIKGLEGLDEERNAAVRDMVKRGEELRKKIVGGDEDGDSDGYGEESSDDDEDDDVDAIRRSAFDELAALDEKDRIAQETAPKIKGVLGMKFMQDAIKRGERKVQGEADELRARLEAMDRAGDAMAEENDSDGEPQGVSEVLHGNLGRMVFGPSAGSQAAASTSTSAPSTKTTHTTKLSGPLAINSTAPVSRASPLSLSAAQPAEEENPWLALGDGQSAGKISRKMNKAATGKDQRDYAKLTSKVDRHKAKQADAREAEKDDAEVEIDLDVVLAPKAKNVPQIAQPKSTKGAKEPAQKSKATAEVQLGGDDSSDDDDMDDAAVDAQRGKGAAAFKQRDLVAKAFAGDNVIADFEAEKRREIERDAPREEDNTLPGWGTWSGKGVKKNKNAKKFVTKIAGIAPAARKDAAFNNVIISEKKDKKASKYMLKDLPFPYTSAAQHEHKLRTPLGHEWSTSTVVRDQTLPKVQIKPGVSIRPLAGWALAPVAVPSTSTVLFESLATPRSPTSRAMADTVALKEHAFYCFDSINGKLNHRGKVPGPTFDDTAEFPLFVTWNIKSRSGGSSRLRGCIGNFEGMPLGEGLQEYAMISAFKDHRFDPITASELARLECGVSLLTDFELCDNYLDWTIDVHGIYLQFPNPALTPSTLTVSTPASSVASAATSTSDFADARPKFRSLSKLPPFVPPSYPNPRNLRRVLSATYLPDVPGAQGWTQLEAIDSAIRKAGWSGAIGDQLRRSIRVTRYQSRKVQATYDEWAVSRGVKK